MPAYMQNPPDLDPHLNLAWETFWALSPSRASNGMGGISGILASEILHYLSWRGLDSFDDQDSQFLLVRALDTAYLAHHHEKAEESRKAKK